MAKRSLSGRRDFQATHRRGRRVHGRVVTAHVRRHHPPGRLSRVGLVVRVRNGRAVARNRIKRRVKAAFRAAVPERGFDVVVRADERAAHAEFQELVTELSRAVGKGTQP